MMKIYFRILFPASGEMRSEFELAVPTFAQAEALARMKWFEGEIVIAGHGGPDFVVPGALEAWVQNLCFDAVSRIYAGEPASFNNFSGPGRIDVEPGGTTVRLRVDGGPGVAFARDELAPELVACGARFLGWARRHKPDDAAYLANLDYIEGFRGPAEAALAAGESGARG